MALARNLKRNTTKAKPLDYKRVGIYVLIFGVVAFGVFGLINLLRVADSGKEKQELKLDTGDKPLPKKMEIWITADDGLFLREKPEPKAKILILVPNGTKLEASELTDGWYKVTYRDKTGWVNKDYVTTQPPAEDPKKNWKTYTNNTYNYSLRYPEGWKLQDFGPNTALSSSSLVGFGSEVSAAYDGNNPPSVVVKISTKTKEQLEAGYKSQGGALESVTISGLPATKFTFNSGSGIQMTAYVISRSSSTVVLEESGGFADELSGIVASLNLG